MMGTARYSERSIFQRFPTLGLIRLVGVSRVGWVGRVKVRVRVREPSEYRPIIAMMLLQDLIAELKSELSGNFSHTITSLCKSPAERDADELRKAMKVALLRMFF